MNRIRQRLFVRSLEDRTAPATFTVMNLNDAGPDSLRDCVNKANVSPGADTISFATSLPGGIFLTTGEITISDALKIQGPGSGQFGITGQNASRHFNLSSAPANTLITISGLRLEGGKSASSGGSIYGEDEVLNLSQCSFLVNSTTAMGGGAVAMTGSGDLIATDCEFTNNSGAVFGGAISAYGAGMSVTLTRCTLSGNKAQTAAAMYVSAALLIESTTVSGNTATKFGGGGIRCTSFYDSAPATILNSTISGNKAVADGGGIALTNFSSQMTLRNSTVSGNSAENGAGIVLHYFDGQLLLQNSTVSTNSASGNGGGIAHISGSGSVQIASTIIAQNFNTFGVGPDMSFKQFKSVVADKCIIGVADKGDFTLSGSGNQTGTAAVPLSAGLLSLFTNGGPTKTHRPFPGSPAIDKGSNPLMLTADQRGAARTVGGGTDVGAVEVQSAANYMVNIAADENDGNYGPGDLSLREAVQLASVAVESADTVTFDPAVAWVLQTITLTLGEIRIDGPVDIIGLGTNNVFISGNFTSRIFNTAFAPFNTVINISGLNLFSGKGPSGSGFLGGGALVGGDEQLSVANCNFSANDAGSGWGGAIAMTATGGSLTVTDCSFINNWANDPTFGGYGGAIAVMSATTKAVLRRCSISGNTAISGGGVYARRYSGNYLLIENCLLSNNSAVGAGGAIMVAASGGNGNLIVRNSTISGNTADAGGGIRLASSAGALTIQNSTITNNTAKGADGGGVSRYFGTATIAIESSIVASNINATSPDIFTGGVVNATLSAVGTKTGITTFNADATTTSLLGANLKLGPLAANGGPTQSHHPLPGSPLLDAGSNSAGQATDQRGATRTLGAKTDIGAVEVVPVSLFVSNSADAGPGSLRQAVTDANVGAGANVVSFDPTFFNSAKTIAIASEIPISDSVTIVGPGPNLATVNGGKVTRLFNTDTAATGTPITIIGLTLTGGKGDPIFNAGGAIACFDEQLTLSNCVFTANSADGGAAVFVYDGVLTATDCIFTKNTTLVGGPIGSIGSSAKLILQRCSVTGNVGGGVNAQNYVLIESSTIAMNSTTQVGGGMSISGGSPVIIRNSTISGNSAGTEGGGIFLSSFSGTLTIQNSTITNNSSGSVGGIARLGGTGSISIESSIVSGNLSSFAPDIYSKGLVQVKTSAIGSGSGFTKSDLGGNLPFQPHANLKLAALANNGGPSLTHLPALNSPLIGTGSNPAGVTIEQRGVGFPRSLGGSIDIGAVEVELPLVVTNADDSGPGSLRQVLSDANALGGPDTVSFDPIFFATAKTIALTTGELLVSDSVSILSPGASIVTVSGNNASRVFFMKAATTIDVQLSGLTITQGNISSNMFGGGIHTTNVNLTVQKSIITANKASFAGGMDIDFGSLTLVDSVVSNNSGAGAIGGVSVFEVTNFTITRSTVSGNSSSGQIGGLYANTTSLTISDSTISGNTSSNRGGGLMIVANGTVAATIINSTISGNTAAGNGAGIFLGIPGGLTFNGTLTVRNSTITNNKSTAGSGGGIGRFSGAGTITLESTIVSGNMAAAGGPDLYTAGTVNSKVSLIGNISGVTTFNPDAFTLLSLGKSPLLGALADNGGPTQTHALLSNSPAINNGANPQLLATDQRGRNRAVDNIDIGAFELQPGAKVTSVVVNDGATQRSRVTSVDVTFDQHVIFLGNAVNAFQLKRQNDGKLPAMSAHVDDTGSGTVVELTFSGTTAVDFGSLADGRYTLTVIANQIGADGLDGTGPATNGDDHVLVGDTINDPKLFRLFGDANGDGTVSSNDFAQLRMVFGLAGSIFDFDDDGQTNSNDFAEFRKRFGLAI